MSAISITCWPTAARYLMPCGVSATDSHGEAKLRTWARNDAEEERLTSVEPQWLRLMQTAATATGIEATVTH